MKIDGKKIAEDLITHLQKKTSILKKQKILPHLAVILIGDDHSSKVYVRQKQKVGESMGIKISNFKFQISNVNKKKLILLLKKLNSDKSIHGIIIQRPLLFDISKDELDRLVIPEKDVDGFHPDSLYTPPISLAALKILKWIYNREKIKKINFINWLKKQHITVIGRGETAGKPIVYTFRNLGIEPQILHSQSANIAETLLKSNIIISGVGKPNIVRHNMVNRQTILIGVGLHSQNGKLKPDYYEDEIAQKVAYYTPVPGGVGPVNVACLFENLISACQLLL